ncbi:hypothetical protein EUX98_g621 [Antrodiella citrinella]|uniref:Uncharacterized protein n=1 Tax=Antrodiella citrinella TaxID=2447956 RepID=A0A4S4N599_9APHY|nr:hypothetical protein EUX98_g621 [Antrodiella citrinella]
MTAATTAALRVTPITSGSAATATTATTTIAPAIVVLRSTPAIVHRLAPVVLL